MQLSELAQFNLPDHPGVYLFKKEGEILYIGKATSLKDRVRSYFAADLEQSRGPRIVGMIAIADVVEFIETDSVLEALVLEAALIKRHQPPANVKDKDDKSFWYVGITKEEFPRVVQIRGKQLADGTLDPDDFEETYGPFISGSELKEALRLIRKIFPYSDEKCEPGSGKPCFNAQIGLCPGVCAGSMNAADYRKQIRHLKLFFEGKKKALLKDLENDMKHYAKEQEFEKASRIKRQLFSLQHIQDVSLLKKPKAAVYGKTGFRIEAYDIAHLGGKNTVGAMVVMEEGELKKSDYRKFKLYGKQSQTADDTANLAEILERRLNHPEWPLPDLIVVDGGKAQINRATEVLLNYNASIPVVSVVKDEHHRARNFLGDPELIRLYGKDITLINAEVHRFVIAFHRKRRDKLV